MLLKYLKEKNRKTCFQLITLDEIPILIFLLIWSGVSSSESLAKKRPYIIVGCFVIGMLITPPDVISQTLLAVPAWLLFELGLLISKLILESRTVTEDKKEGE